MSPAFWLRVGAVWGFLAISMGAFGAHGLEGAVHSRWARCPAALPPSASRRTFNTAAQYHMYCALAILAVGILAQIGRGGAALQAAGWLFLLGSLIFSGSLYVLATTGLRWLGAITPIGGVAMIAAWVALAVAAGSLMPIQAVAHANRGEDKRPFDVGDAGLLDKIVGGLPPDVGTTRVADRRRRGCKRDGERKSGHRAEAPANGLDAGALENLSDGALLERFLSGRGNADSASAFAALVERHGPMVLGVCRDVLRDLHDAEDAVAGDVPDPGQDGPARSAGRLAGELAFRRCASGRGQGESRSGPTGGRSSVEEAR